MTVSSTTQKQLFTGNGISTTFAIPFSISYPFYASSHVVVYSRDNSVDPAVTTLLVNPTDYTIVGTNVVLAAAPAATTNILIKRVVPLTQLIDYIQNSSFPIQNHEDALDKLTFITQQLLEIITRSAKLSDATSIADLALPEPSPGELLAWNAGGTGLMNANSGNLGFLTALLAQDSQAIANYQTPAADITNLLFDGTAITSVMVFYEIARPGRFTNGILMLRYRSGTWEAEDGVTVGDTSGVTFSITTVGTNGQVQYISNNVGGAGTIKWRTITFS